MKKGRAGSSSSAGPQVEKKVSERDNYVWEQRKGQEPGQLSPLEK